MERTQTVTFTEGIKMACSNLKNAFFKNNKKIPESKIFNEERAVAAKSAYMQAKYGHSLTQTDLLKRFFANANAIIKEKCLAGTYCCMIEIDNDIKEHIAKIVYHFKTKLGYKLAIIDNNTIISNKDDSSTVNLQPNSTFLILMWNDADISETVFSESEKIIKSTENEKIIKKES